ncbi:hypothetical protein [Burkholderia ubonensis]|uniref:hypothetical protein n=1 Tax=Burkholderia ubonensis TaxID=101571 RepID=UPI001E60147E|nr:hypothetical protein [Burkholderia ubonensis]
MTLQEAEGWHGQYQRMLRWHDRVCAIDAERSSAEQLDFLIAFFVACFHLRDWLKDAGVDAERLNASFRANVELRVCRDIANGFKHSRLDREPFDDPVFSIVREYVPAGWPSNAQHTNARWLVVAGDSKLDLVELAGRCVSIWDGFLGETLCPWTPRVFDPRGMAEGAHARWILMRAQSRAKPQEKEND